MKPILMLLAMMALDVQGSTITNFTLVSIQGQVVTKQIELKAGQTLSMVQYLATARVYLAMTTDGVRLDNVRWIEQNADPRSFAPLNGPGIVELSWPDQGAPSGQQRAIVSLEIDGTPPPGGVPVVNIPSNAVVIPADGAGPVHVLLESSIDLITWNSALPGIYGTSTTNRFFRVRTVRD